MNVFSMLSLFAFVVYVYIGFYSYRLEIKAGIKSLFILLCSSGAIWSLSYSFEYVSASDHGFWIKLSALGWCFFSAIILHLVLVFTDSPIIDNKLVKFLIYLPAYIFFCMSVLLFWPGKEPAKNITDFFYIGDFIYDFVYSVLSIVLIYIWGKKSKSLREQKQAGIIVKCSAIPFVLNLIEQTLLPALGLHELPNVGQILSLIMILGVYYAIVKYKLFAISTNLVLDEILAEMADLIFIITPEGYITKVSKRTELLLGYSQLELSFKPMSDILLENRVIEEICTITRDNALHRYTELHCIKKSGDLIPVNLSCSPIVDPVLDELVGLVLVGHDMTITKKLEKEIVKHTEAEKKIRESEEKFRAMFNKHAAVMYLLDPDTLQFYSVNEAAQRFYGYTSEAFDKLKITDLNSLEVRDEKSLINQVLSEKNNIFYMTHTLANGEKRDVEIHASPIPSAGKTMIFSIVHDITERKKAEEYITFLAYHDSLTGLTNRKHFYERLQFKIECSDHRKELFALIYIDLDDFKQINDNYGHETGDHLLCEIADRLQQCITEKDVVSRLGGDEFILMLHDVGSMDEIACTKDHIRRAIETPMERNGIQLQVKASLGVSIYPQDGMDVDSLINSSDSEMYVMKRQK